MQVSHLKVNYKFNTINKILIKISICLSFLSLYKGKTYISKIANTLKLLVIGTSILGFNMHYLLYKPTCGIMFVLPQSTFTTSMLKGLLLVLMPA